MHIELEQLLDLPEVEITSVEIEAQRMTIHCRSCLGEALCPSCLKASKEVRKTYHRRIRDLSITGRAVYLLMEVRQFHCFDCDRYFSERFSFVDLHRSYTKRYEDYIYFRCQGATIRQVSLQEDLLWDVVNAIFLRKAKKDLSFAAWGCSPVRWLGIDELSLRKGQSSYACVVVDLERACVIDVLPQRTADYLINYFQSKGEAFLRGVEIFSMDMWKGFVKVAQKLMPQALIVVDRFHLIGQLHQALDSYRRSLRRRHPKAEALKGIKWLLLKHKEALSEAELERLEAAFACFPPLEQCYLLKETLRHGFDHFEDRGEAEQFLDHWIAQAETLKNRYLNRFLNTLDRWKDKILNYFEGRITNGLVEGINHAIRQIMRRAYGYLNFQHFRLRILTECR